MATNIHGESTAFLNSWPLLRAPGSLPSAKSPQLLVAWRLLMVGENGCQLQFSGAS